MPLHHHDSAAAALLATTATRIERDMTDMVERWSAMGEADREAVLAHLAGSAPGIVRLLCPGYGRFAAH